MNNVPKFDFLNKFKEVNYFELEDRFNIDVVYFITTFLTGSKASKTMLDPILNETTTPDMQPRNRNPDKYDTSPYILLSEGESSVSRVHVFSRIKHSFESHNDFDVGVDLINEFIE
ncbi:hypothetical protein RDI58_013666 [Solanum bulbocastanum]|uniref:Uncharacterized protein n=1 Tax=Solanum bulbocastanum TaxID=147425 RepID=A0AAN8YFF4_SOLBU